MANVKNIITLGIGAAPGNIKWFVTTGLGIGEPPFTWTFPDISGTHTDEWMLVGGSDIDAFIPDLMHIEALPCLEDADVEQSLEIPSSLPAEPDLTGSTAKEWEML